MNNSTEIDSQETAQNYSGLRDNALILLALKNKNPLAVELGFRLQASLNYEQILREHIQRFKDKINSIAPPEKPALNLDRYRNTVEHRKEDIEAMLRAFHGYPPYSGSNIRKDYYKNAGVYESLVNHYGQKLVDDVSEKLEELAKQMGWVKK